jgi:hypothetical protein
VKKSLLIAGILSLLAVSVSAQFGQALQGKVAGNKTERVTYIENFGNWVEQTRTLHETATYDNLGRQTEKATCDDDGSLLMKRTFSYDDVGNNAEYDDYNSAGSILSKGICLYDLEKKRKISTPTYDANGSMTDRESLFDVGQVIFASTIARYGLDVEQPRFPWRPITRYNRTGNKRHRVSCNIRRQ